MNLVKTFAEGQGLGPARAQHPSSPAREQWKKKSGRRWTGGSRVGRARLDVLDGDGAAADGDGGEDLAALLDVDGGRAGGADGGAARGRRGRRGEDDGAEVGEGHERGALLEVLDDPLRVVLAERRLAGERVRDGLALGLVRDRRRAARLGRRGDRHGDDVARGEADAGEVVRVVGVPLIPSCAAEMARSAEGVAVAEGVRRTIVADAGAGDGEVDTGLEDGGVAGVTVDANPCGGGVGPRAARRLARGGDREGTRHGGVGGLKR